MAEAEARYFFTQNKVEHGPVPGAHLKRLAASGRLKPTDQVKKEGLSRWVTAGSVKGLFPVGDAPGDPPAEQRLARKRARLPGAVIAFLVFSLLLVLGALGLGAWLLGDALFGRPKPQSGPQAISPEQLQEQAAKVKQDKDREQAIVAATLKSGGKVNELTDLAERPLEGGFTLELPGGWQVRRVSFQGVPLRGPELELLKGLTELRHLNLKDTHVGDAALAHLEGVTQLEMLELNDTPVGDEGLRHLRGLIALKALGLRKTRAGDAGLVYLKDMRQLMWLDLRNTQVGDAGLAHLEHLPQLKALLLDGTKVSDEGLGHLQNMSQLTELRLLGTQVTGAGVAKLQRALPRTQITWQIHP
jgi:hypothetical protein